MYVNTVCRGRKGYIWYAPSIGAESVCTHVIKCTIHVIYFLCDCFFRNNEQAEKFPRSLANSSLVCTAFWQNP